MNRAIDKGKKKEEIKDRNKGNKKWVYDFTFSSFLFVSSTKITK
jgi:hypothetical protein